MTAHDARRDAERLAGLTAPYLTLEEAAQKAGVPADQVEAVWTASGLPVPDPGEAALGDGDVAILRAIADLEACGLADEGLVLQLARVTGRHVRRIAEAQVAAAAHPTSAGLTDRVRHTIPVLERTMVHLWRRHLADAAMQATLLADEPGEPQATGFVDLVGFTARSQQVDEAQLADLVTRFEHQASTVVARHGGTVVKTMGDELMFVHRDPVQAALVALDLVDACDEDPTLPAARGGVAWGRPVVLGGDYFGPPVNLASRITKLALPGTVLVDPRLADLLHGSRAVHTKRLRPQKVRDVGRVALHVVRRGHRDDETPLDDGADDR